MLPRSINSTLGHLTHWGWVMHICVSKLTIIGSDNGLSPGQCQAIIWTYDGILLIRISGTKLNENLSEIHICSFKKMHLKMSSAKWWQYCLGLNVLNGVKTGITSNTVLHVTWLLVSNTATQVCGLSALNRDLYLPNPMWQIPTKPDNAIDSVIKWHTFVNGGSTISMKVVLKMEWHAYSSITVHVKGWF